MDKQHLPLLLTSDQSEKHYFYSLLENRYEAKHVPILRNKSVLGSAHGWLALVDRSEGDSKGECCLWNPTSMDTIQLSNLENPLPYIRCFFSKPPTDPNCFLVLSRYISEVQVVYRINDNFKVNSVQLAGGYLLLVAMVSFQGLTYGIVQPLRESYYKFVTIHLTGDTLEMRPLLIDGQRPWEVPISIRRCISSNMYYLIESPCGSELLLVIRMAFDVYLNNCVHFRVFRVDVDRMEFVELDNLDGRTIFINFFGNGFCRSSESVGAAAACKLNSIYYTNMNGSVIYVYGLDDRSTITLQPYPNADIDRNKSESYWVDFPDIFNSSGLV